MVLLNGGKLFFLVIQDSGVVDNSINYNKLLSYAESTKKFK